MNKLAKNNKGSILIWVIALGVMLTSVFFFFGSRLRMNAQGQQGLMRWQSQKTYAESYAHYLSSLSPMILNSLASADFDDITGTVSKETDVIEGFLDNGQSSPVYNITEPVTIEWNRCDLEQEGDLLIREEGVPHYHAPNCSPEKKSDELTEFTPDPIEKTITLQALNGPTHYRITSKTDTKLSDNKFHLKLAIPIALGKTYKIEETFTP
ncbi:MAG: hypothetical protein V1760_00270 [Candidatus Peregrinibacteria bacterium]